MLEAKNSDESDVGMDEEVPKMTFSSTAGGNKNKEDGKKGKDGRKGKGEKGKNANMEALPFNRLERLKRKEDEKVVKGDREGDVPMGGLGGE